MSSTCPRCGHSASPDWEICPNCGLRKPAGRGKIRCGVCGHVNPGTYRVCSSCGADLASRPFAFLIGKAVYFKWFGVALLVAVMVSGVVRIRADVEQGADQVISFFMPTPTATATATGTPTATFTVTATPTVTPTDTPPPTATVTATSTVTPTATAVPPTAVPQALPTDTPAPTPTPRLSVPVLKSPKDGEIFVGRSQMVVLSWEPSGVLAADEWYAVRLSWSEGGVVAQRGGNNVKETSWQLPADMFWARADQETGRAYQWYVFVERVTETEEGERQGEPVSPSSEVRTFYWQ